RRGYIFCRQRDFLPPSFVDMGVQNDRWIRKMALEHGMIEPFAEGQVRQNTEDGSKVISYGVSSYGYDMRISREFKVFTNVYNQIVDPKAFAEQSMVPM